MAPGGMTKKESALYTVVGWLGVSLGAASAVSAVVKADPRIWMSLSSSSLLGLWIASLLFFKSAKTHQLEVEAVLKTFLQGSNKERHLLENSLRALLFEGSQIDDEFCVWYGEVLLSEGDDSALDRVREVFEAKRTNKIRVDRGKSYHLMHYLFRKVAEQGEKYLALATELDLSTPEAADFLFKDPLDYPASISRIFVLRSRESLQKLIDAAGVDLARQQVLGVGLKVLIDPGGAPLNFGIYGSVAVGYFEDRGTNVFDFQRANIENKKRIYSALWSRAEELGPYLPKVESAATGKAQDEAPAARAT